jgi:hypothetical protein
VCFQTAVRVLDIKSAIWGSSHMKNFWFIAAIFLVSLSGVHNAAAFSTDQRNYQNSDGSPKFEDPDEQMPNFILTPDQAGTGSRSSFSGAPAVTVPAPGDNSPGAMAFDRAFSHQQDKE